MDTKFKNTNIAVKLLCFLLSVMLIMISAFCALRVAQTAYYFRSGTSHIRAILKEDKQLSDFTQLSDKLCDDMYYLYLTTDDDTQKREKLSEFLDKEKPNFLNSAMRSFNEQRKAIGIGTETQTTTLNMDEEEYPAEDVSVAYGDENDGLFLFSYVINTGDESYVLNTSDYEEIYLSDDEEHAYSLLDLAYEIFVNEEILQGEPLLNAYTVSPDLQYYVYNRDNGKENTNISKERLEELKDNQKEKYLITVTNGVPVYSYALSGVLDGDLDKATGALNLVSTEHCDFVLLIDENLTTADDTGYESLFNLFQRLQSYSVKTDIIIGMICGVLGAVLALYLMNNIRCVISS